jgi:hypothetical protein
MMGDFNGDGKADIIIFLNGKVYISYSNGRAGYKPKFEINST